MSPLCASFACHYIQFYPYWPLKILREERQDHPNYRQKLKSLFPFAFIIIGLELHGQFYTLFLSSTLRYLTHWKRVILPRTSWGSTVHTFLVIFQCTFHLLKKVRYIIIIPTAVRVCNWQHFLLITIVIIIPINKIINHHNQCITEVSVICPALYSWRCLIR